MEVYNIKIRFDEAVNCCVSCSEENIFITSIKSAAMFQSLSVGVREVVFGNQVTIIAPCNLYECTIGDESFVGPFVEIQKGVTIGSRCKIQSHSFICELVTIGNDCFVGHGVMFVNDLFSNGGPSGNSAGWKPTFIGNRISIGSNATILPLSLIHI